MSKIFGLTLALLFTGMFMHAQQCSHAGKTAVKSEKTSCSEAEMKKCAAKMGMSLEECKAVCNSKQSGSLTSTTGHAGVVHEAGNTSGNGKTCTPACAAKCGMTLEECQKKCNGSAGKAARASRE